MRRVRKGFTFVELLVTVALLALLAAMVLPRLVLPAPDGALLLRRILSEGALQAQREGAVLYFVAQGGELVLQAPSAGTEPAEPERGRYSLEGPWEIVLVPEKLLLFPDGSYSPTRIGLKADGEERIFHVTVTGQILEIGKR